MRVEKFLAEHGLAENPFAAEEARHDPVFDRMVDTDPGHPDFTKILGQIDKPTTSVVFGEKGSGKTAIRLLIGRRVDAHNAASPERRTLLVAYDDLNPVIDRVLLHRRRRGAMVEQASTTADLLETIRLEDHQDAILSLAVTKLIDALLATKDRTKGEPSQSLLPMPEPLPPRIKQMPRRIRVDLATIAALYDQPRSGDMLPRWSQLCSMLRLRRISPVSLLRVFALACTLMAAGFGIADVVIRGDGPWPTAWSRAVASLSAAAAFILWGGWLRQHFHTWRLARRIRREMPAIERSVAQLRTMVGQLRYGDRSGQPWPVPGMDSRQSRYQLTEQFMDVLEAIGYGGMLILVDRVDEPTLIGGDATSMRSMVWPLLDNKFLQQERVGVKLLLPIELRHHLLHETAHFFQEARLDKQNLIDHLAWSGSTLYDLCSARLQVCCLKKDHHGTLQSDQGQLLMDLFEEGVTRDLITDALDTMQQPRDAFKFLYGLIQEHCRIIPDDQPVFRISRLTVEAVRRHQTKRVQDFQRGQGPG